MPARSHTDYCCLCGLNYEFKWDAQEGMLDMGCRCKVTTGSETLVSFLFCETFVNTLTEMHSGYILLRLAG